MHDSWDIRRRDETFPRWDFLACFVVDLEGEDEVWLLRHVGQWDSILEERTLKTKSCISMWANHRYKSMLTFLMRNIRAFKMGHVSTSSPRDFSKTWTSRRPRTTRVVVTIISFAGGDCSTIGTGMVISDMLEKNVWLFDSTPLGRFDAAVLVSRQENYNTTRIEGTGPCPNVLTMQLCEYGHGWK